MEICRQYSQGDVIKVDVRSSLPREERARAVVKFFKALSAVDVAKLDMEVGRKPRGGCAVEATAYLAYDDENMHVYERHGATVHCEHCAAVKYCAVARVA